MPLVIQPVAYRQNISALLFRRLEDPPSPKSVPSLMSVATLKSQNIPHSEGVFPKSLPVSAISTQSASNNRNAPSFKEFSRILRNKRLEASEAVSPSPQISPEFRAVPYELVRRSLSISPRTSDFYDRSLVPGPLSIYKNRDKVIEGVTKTKKATVEGEEDRSQSRFSKSSSDDSFVIYTGVRDYVRHKLRKKRESPKKERKRVMSAASTKYPGMLTAKEFDGRFSTSSPKESVQQGVSRVYRKLSRLSISGPSGHSNEEKKQPQGRQKQLAIPTSPYQKYGAAVWEAPKRPKKAEQKSASARTSVKKNTHSQAKRRPSRSANPSEVVGAFRSGRNQIIHALDGTKHKLKRTNSEKRRDALKQSIKLIGPTNKISDGIKNYHI
jgi:hypothetical protein